ILTGVFISNIEEKIRDFETDNFGGLLAVPPYIQWDNVKLNGNRLLIEKSAKPLDKFSRYAGISGTIQSEIISDKDKTILRARITLDTAMADVLKYVLGTVVGLSGVLWLVFDFDFRILIGLLAIEWFIFWVTPRFQNTALDDLVDYYNVLINEAVKK
ncbi:MAG: hypothetical protein C0490_17165, partial [Marivirga sp.]|nr:hypothetical protein [Marivirga sp.]